MADPQLEKGYTRIANELLEAVCRTNLSGSELRILLYIIRRTYGFNRSYAEIPLSEIAGAVGMNKVNVSRALFQSTLPVKGATAKMYITRAICSLKIHIFAKKLLFRTDLQNIRSEKSVLI